MLITILLPGAIEYSEMDDSQLIHVTGTTYPNDKVAVDFDEYWIGHPADGGVQVKRSVHVRVLKREPMFAAANLPAHPPEETTHV